MAPPKALQTEAERRALVAACREPWFKRAVALSLYAGHRLGEVASARTTDIATVEGYETIAILRSWEGPLKHRRDDQDAEDAARVVLLHPELAKVLRETEPSDAGDRLVLVDGKRPLDEATDTDMARRVRRACKRAGLTPVTFHELRASYTTIAANNGVPLASLQAALGHGDIATTAVYVRPDPRRAALDPRFLGAHVLHTAPIADSADLN